MPEYSPSTLPPISRVEVVVLDDVNAALVSDFMTAATEAQTVKVEGATALRLAQMWRELPPGETDRCHIPPFGLRFIADGQVVCQGSICWECNNIYGDIVGVPFVYEFDAEAQVSRALLAELLALVEELQKPVVISTSRFGDLLYDRSVDWFEGEVEWNGERIRVSFSIDDDNDITSGLKTAEALWNAQAEWKRMVDDFAVQELLPLKNDNWLDEDEEPITADEFKARMTLESISISPDGSFEFWHHDGDLFWGHSIQISGSMTDGLTDADIPG